ncbi:hypothetical protein QUV83_08115 [Cellulomonas cellasea]|uniref:hypothetical protein n=1 Tax=Cellulomonas cellasea TaxID=43670 RepID=UPI0025A3A4AF|nr:hypothetical protein [Cellulomonas cellasea]MDM8084724.1 hypothetical protein [Cellulomonas cellasea]
MARDHARIRLDIWADDDFRELTSSGQWLYMHLLTHPTLSFAGVADWRPARIAAHTRELTAHDIEMFAAELETGEYLVIDRDSEEALVRSFVKHDGLMRSPNMAKALVKAHAEIASATLRAVVIDQLKRLEIAQPQLTGWNLKEVEKLLKKRSATLSEAVAELPRNPSANPSGNPSRNPSGNPSEIDATLPNSLTPFLPGSESSSKLRTEPHQRAS